MIEDTKRGEQKPPSLLNTPPYGQSVWFVTLVIYSAKYASKAATSANVLIQSTLSSSVELL